MPPQANMHSGAISTYHLNDSSSSPIDQEVTYGDHEGATCGSAAAASEEDSFECVFKRVLMDFSYQEQPVRCFLTCQAQQKKLSSNTKGMVFASQSMAENEDFTLVPETDGTIVILSTKHNRFLCSDATGVVYASQTRHKDMEKWMMVESSSNLGGFHITSFITKKKLALCSVNDRNVVTTDKIDDERNFRSSWSIEFSSGELCFLSLPLCDTRLRCDFSGVLSMSNNFKGWEAWRLSEAGDGFVRISPWAHSEKLLCADDKGGVCTTETRGELEKWSIEKAPSGYLGVVIKSANHGRILQYNTETETICTIAEMTDLDSSCIWQFESLHQKTYYMAGVKNNKRIGANKTKGVSISSIPFRKSSEEWRIQATDKCGVVTVFSIPYQSYMVSFASGDVSLLTETNDDGSEMWILEERDQGTVLVSYTHKRVLDYSPDGKQLITSIPDDPNTGMNLRLEPKVPQKVSKEKIKAVGMAVSIGVATTVFTPILLTGAIGLVGITEVGVAGHIVIGSIRAAEALSSITRLSASSSKLILSEASIGHVQQNSGKLVKEEICNRPFCAWRSW